MSSSLSLSSLTLS
ncbi:hypothetical protein OIU74_028081, partial [Salix koriyanagi]